ncbi:hypothetical protein F7D01_09515 [Erythrobacter sp. 3-20A1M]|uniref:hypothetical protein n=1 Tax=Erythrobacter sp. 3-20A1M TaxID=2653850 RepID=UPI001BFC433B|nr:hypothetical protein [Erythrobacter sp. 3-20A1M]QWC57292.1 hypothetical protein F7D01_09515 [Erythrobacter sp. 3-20A1M]
MMITSVVATMLLAQAAGSGSDRIEVAYDELSANRNATAIRKMERTDDGMEDSAARLINLGIAYARAGDTDRARDLFTRAARAERYDLETADGEWVDSRKLALQALASLDRGDFHTVRTASR